MEPLGLLAGVVALLLALAFTPVARALAHRIGFIDNPGGRKIHRAPTAYLGGVAVALSTLFAIGVTGYLWYWLLHSKSPIALEWCDRIALDDDLADPALINQLFVCWCGSIGALLWGLADDRWVFSPWVKLAGQTLLAILMVYYDVRLTALVGDGLFMQTVTVLWIVLITNSFNLLDNMDGLCAGTGAIAAGVLALVALISAQAPLALALFALAGACLGFLRYNLNPASIFLGDAGSMFIGFQMATFSVVTTYFHYRESRLSVGIPFLILAIPLYDTASVLWIRFREGRKLFHGDTSHFSHRLVQLGMTRRQAVGTIHLAALAIALPAVVISSLKTEHGLLLYCQALLILTLIALLERAGRSRETQAPASALAETKAQETAATNPSDSERVLK